MKTPQILIDAQDNWPEDEASLTADAHANRQNDGYTMDESVKVLHRDIAHMHKVFSFENDANELVTRYNAELLKRGIDVKTLEQRENPDPYYGVGGRDKWDGK